MTVIMHQPASQTTGSTMPDQGSSAYVFLLCAVAALGGLLFGFDTAIINGALDYLKIHFHIQAGTFAEGFLVASAIVGCIPGVLISGPLSDRFGRKNVLIISAILYLISSIGSAIPPSVAVFYLFRFIGGMGVGAASMASPLYIAEVAPARVRGTLVALNQLTIITGILMSYIICFFLKDVHGALQNWQWMLGSAAAPSLFFLAAMFFLPESPRWLTEKGREAQAMAILARVGGRASAEAQMVEIKDALDHDRSDSTSGSVWQLFQPGLRLALMIGVVLAVLQQITGINTVIYYSTTTFKDAGMGEGAALLGSVGVGVVNFIMTLIAMALVEKVGRRPLMIYGPLAMGLSLALLGLAFKHHWLSAILLFTFTYVAAFAVSIGPVLWVVISEIFPTRIRGRAMSFSIVALWIACYLVAFTLPKMFELIGKSGTAWFYAAMCAVMVVFDALFVPETKGRTLEQIEKHWTRP